jgi:hypothetical protein
MTLQHKNEKKQHNEGNMALRIISFLTHYVARVGE